jgi:hypothetical protein
MLARCLPLCLAVASCVVAAAHGRGAEAAGTTIALASSVTTGTAPIAVTLTATVTGTALSGNILFRDGTLSLGTAAISKSKATLTITLDAGIHRLSAAYTAATPEIASTVTHVIVDNALACK